MGYRKLTDAEFLHIKSLLKKFKGDFAKVAKTVSRSEWTVKRVSQFDTFIDYGSRQNPKPIEKPSVKRPRVYSKPVKSYGGAILAEMKRQRIVAEKTRETFDAHGYYLSRAVGRIIDGRISQLEYQVRFWFIISLILGIGAGLMLFFD